MGQLSNTIVGIPVVQNQQEFLVGVFSIGQVLKFTKYTKRFVIGFDENNESIYNPEIQRNVEKSRVEKIADFLIDDPEATFPTNIVLHIPQQVIKKQTVHKSTNREAFNYLEIELFDIVYEEVNKEKRNENSGNIFVTIIDGQHRIKGIEIAIDRLNSEIEVLRQTLVKSPSSTMLKEKLAKYSQRLTDLYKIQLVVSFFIDKSLEYQAMIFSTINRTQKRVSESLVYSLFGISTKDSPYKSALQITYTLNAHPKSPFLNRVKLYGGDYDTNQSPPLSQATMVKSIVQLISENLYREAEKDRYKSRKELLKRTPGSTKYLPFRRYYATDHDTRISDIFFYYFSAIRTIFSQDNGETSLWDFDPDHMKPTNVIQTTVGYLALLDILVDVLEEIDTSGIGEDKKFAIDYYSNKLSNVNEINVADIQRYPFTSKSRTILYLDVSLKVWKPMSNSDPRLLKLKEAIER